MKLTKCLLIYDYDCDGSMSNCLLILTLASICFS